MKSLFFFDQNKDICRKKIKNLKMSQLYCYDPIFLNFLGIALNAAGKENLLKFNGSYVTNTINSW